MHRIAVALSVSFFAAILIPHPAYAIPSLLPVIPIIAAVGIKAAAITGSIIFFALSIIRKNKKVFTLLGFVMFVVSLFLMAFYY